MAPLEDSQYGSDDAKFAGNPNDILAQLFEFALRGDVQHFATLYECTDEKPDLGVPRLPPFRGLHNKAVFEKSVGQHQLRFKVRMVDLAAFMGHESMVLYLLDQDRTCPESLPDGGFADDDKTTLLHLSAKTGLSKVIERLIKRTGHTGERLKREYLDVRSRATGLGSDPRRNGSRGTTALETAAVWGHWDVVALLIKHGADVGVAIYAAFDAGQAEIAAHLIEECFLGDECDAEGNTPLHAAAECGMDKEYRKMLDYEKAGHISRAIELMLEMRVDPSRHNGDDRTAWDVAFARQNTLVMSILAEKEIMEFKDYGSRGCPIDFAFQTAQGASGSGGGAAVHWPDDGRPVRVRGNENNLTQVLGFVRAIVQRGAEASKTREFETPLTQLVDSYITRPQWKRAQAGLHRRDAGFRVEQFVSSSLYQFEIVSVAIPYLWVSTNWGLQTREVHGTGPLSPQQLRFCGTSNRCTLRQCSPLTLDEHANPGLGRKILQESNRDQVLFRHSRRTKYRQSPRHVEVRQAWAFKIDEDLIFSTQGPELFLPPRIYHSKANHSIGILIASAINAMNQQPIYADEASIFDAFREEIMNLSMAVNDHIDKKDIRSTDLDDERRFTHEINDIREELSMMRRVLSQQEEIWREFTFHTWTRPEHWPEGPNGVFKPVSHAFSGKEKPQDEQKQTKLSDEVDQLRKELAAMKRAMKYNNIQGPSNDDASHGSSRTTSGSESTTEQGAQTGGQQTTEEMAIRDAQHPQYLIARSKRIINELDEDAERVERSIQIRLDLRQKHISLRETHNMSVMSASVFAFTIITIIFTPLSFTTSLFALPIDQVVRHQTTLVVDTPTFGTTYIGAWLAVVEIAALLVTSAAMIVAFKWFLGVRLGDMVFRPARDRLRHMLAREQDDSDTESLPGDLSDTGENHQGIRGLVYRGRSYVGRKSQWRAKENGKTDVSV